MLETQNSFPSGICIKKPKPRLPRELGLPLSLTGLGPAWETKLILGKGKAARQPGSSKEVASAVSQVGQSPANPSSGTPASCSCSQPHLQSSVAATSCEPGKERLLRVTHNGIHNLLQQKSNPQLQSFNHNGQEPLLWHRLLKSREHSREVPATG